MAVVKWLSEFDKYKFRKFVSVRKYFEDFLILNSRAIGEAISARGSRGRSVPTLISYYELILTELLIGTPPKKIITKMKKDRQLKPLATAPIDYNEYGPGFSREVKSGVFLADALNGVPPCRICGARYQPDSVNADHIKPKSQGGLGTADNLGPTHYYCNGGKDVLEPLIETAWKRIEERL
jgi:hypothetical protein